MLFLLTGVFFLLAVHILFCVVFFFFFQAEDGIRDYKVTGVQTCALPIFRAAGAGESGLGSSGRTGSCRAAQHRRVPRGFWTGGYSGRSGDGRLSRVGRDRYEDDAAGKLPTGGRGSMLGAGRPAPARARRVAGWRNGRADGRAASAGTRSDEGAPSSR